MEFGRRNVGIVGTCFNIFKCFIGIGLLALPHAFSSIGIIGGCIAIILIGSLNYYTMMLQIECKLKYGGRVETYSDLAFVVFGRYGKIVVDFSLFSSQIGCCIAYLLFVGKQFDQVICFETDEKFCGKKADYIMLGALIVAPVCCLRTFKFISYLSGFANMTICFASKLQYPQFIVAVIIYDSVQNVEEHPE